MREVLKGFVKFPNNGIFLDDREVDILSKGIFADFCDFIDAFQGNILEHKSSLAFISRIVSDVRRDSDNLDVM